MPDVSIIIPVYNAEKYLDECLVRAAAQSGFSSAEVIITDDGSADASAGICDGFSQKYQNVKVIHKKNGGVSAARNDGISAASSDYIMFCDADDYYQNDIIEKVINAARDHSPDLIFWDYTYQLGQDLRETRFDFTGSQELDRACLRRVIPEFMLSDLSFNSIWNKAFRKDIITKNGILFNTQKKYGEDREFLLQFLAGSSSGYYIKQSGYFYRDTVSGAIRKERTDFFDNIYDDYLTNVRCYSSLDFSKEEIESLCRSALPEQIINDVFFIYDNYGKSIFDKSLNRLFETDFLMESVSDYLSEGRFKNDNYRSAAQKIMLRKASALRRFLGMLKAKESIYKILKG